MNRVVLGSRGLKALGIVLGGTIFAAGFVACTEETGGATPSTSAESETTPEASEEATPDELNLALGETAKIGDAQVTANSCRIGTSEILPADEGFQYIVVDATIVNTGDDAYSLSSVLQMEARDAEARTYNVTIGVETNGNLDGTIPTGDTLRGETVHEVPAGGSYQWQFKQAFGDQVARWNLACA